MSGEMGVGRARAPSTPVTKSEVDSTSKTASLANGVAVQASTVASQPPEVAKAEGEPKSASDSTNPPSNPISTQNLQVRTDVAPETIVDTTATGTTRSTTTQTAPAPQLDESGGVDQRTEAAKALHREATDALGFLLGDLKAFVKSPPHTPMADAHSGNFEPTNDAHVSAAKDMLKQLIKEHTGPLGREDGVAKAAKRVLEALDNAVDNLKGSGIDFGHGDQLLFDTTRPLVAPPVIPNDDNQETEADALTLSDAMTDLQNAIVVDRDSSLPPSSDDGSSVMRARSKVVTERPAFLDDVVGGQKPPEDQAKTTQPALSAVVDELRSTLIAPKTGSERPPEGPGIGSDPTELAELPKG